MRRLGSRGPTRYLHGTEALTCALVHGVYNGSFLERDMHGQQETIICSLLASVFVFLVPAAICVRDWEPQGASWRRSVVWATLSFAGPIILHFLPDKAPRKSQPSF